MTEASPVTDADAARPVPDPGPRPAPAAAVAPAPTPSVRTSGLCRSYRRGEAVVHALQNVDLELYPGGITFIVGPSGSGKSTLLHLLGALDRPSAGEVWLGDRALSALASDALATVRRERLGFVFQSFHLLDTLDAVGNVTISGVPGGLQPADTERAEALLDRVGLAARKRHRPSELSGGEQQRVAIARALFRDPTIVLADEPTGELDSHTSREILALLREVAATDARTVVIVTHDQSLLAQGDRVVRLRDGRVVEDGPAAD